MVAASTAAHACSVVVTEEFAFVEDGCSRIVCAVAPEASAMHSSRMQGYLQQLQADVSASLVMPCVAIAQGK